MASISELEDKIPKAKAVHDESNTDERKELGQQLKAAQVIAV